MKSKVALVTGATGGIGGEICKALIKEGYQVIAGYYSGGQHEKAQKWQVEMSKQGLWKYSKLGILPRMYRKDQSRVWKH